MSTTSAPTRPPSVVDRPPLNRGRGRIVERTTTITHELYLDDPCPPQQGRSTNSTTAPSETPLPDTALPETDPNQSSSTADRPLNGVDRAVVRLGVRLIELGRRRALRQARRAQRPTLRSDEIARRVDAAKARNLKHVIGLPY